MAGGGILGVFVHQQALTVVQLHLIFDEVAQEGSDGSDPAADDPMQWA